jgi:hypothetical protein
LITATSKLNQNVIDSPVYSTGVYGTFIVEVMTTTLTTSLQFVGLTLLSNVSYGYI